jgi:hypothetical protein
VSICVLHLALLLVLIIVTSNSNDNNINMINNDAEKYKIVNTKILNTNINLTKSFNV